LLLLLPFSIKQRRNNTGSTNSSCGGDSSPHLKTLTSSAHSHPRSAVAILRFAGFNRHVATQSGIFFVHFTSSIALFVILMNFDLVVIAMFVILKNFDCAVTIIVT
jgi:hypothetical protein